MRTRTISGTTSAGGTTDTVVSIMPDNSIRFTDRNGNTQVIQGLPPNYTTAFQNRLQPSTTAFRGDAANALFALVDALIART
ncbi:MAG: hypothetical protein EPO41_03985 [Reyranella sp.]|uniref:hypothetical protein n=1 Tax=Reyranella sp. TaxID=1929291 RepID=UPI0012181EB7|nr:hypothetical protein [Reyranella sp.]TAJ97161.1 MAG: hypothetical protein EPO41_03985 [Reyranella sp.]